MVVNTHLDTTDIQSIIAQHFGVAAEDVFIDCYMETIGYGLNEHKEPMVRAVVTSHGEVKEAKIKSSFEESVSNGWIYG